MIENDRMEQSDRQKAAETEQHRQMIYCMEMTICHTEECQLLNGALATFRGKLRKSWSTALPLHPSYRLF